MCLDGFIQSDIPSAVLHVIESSSCDYSLVLMVEGSLMGDLETVLELKEGFLRPGGDGPLDRS